MEFQNATKVILPYKICAAGENFRVPDRYSEDFTLQNRRRKRKIVDSSLIVDRDSESYTIVDCSLQFVK